MNAHTQKDLQQMFRRIGSDFMFHRDPWRRGFRLDVRDEIFHLHEGHEPGSPVNARILDLNRPEKHLLLEVHPVGGPFRTDRSKFLCGHDERHYFAAGVPAASRDVDNARLLLVPKEIREQVAQMPRKYRFEHKNEIYKRQGEWFFVPVSDLLALDLDNKYVALKNEPIRRGRSKPHMVQKLVRMGGTSVQVHPQFAPNGVSLEARDKIVAESKKDGALWARSPDIGWRSMTRDAKVFALGKVTHKDHATLKLDTWHQVLLSNEVLTEKMAFLD